MVEVGWRDFGSSLPDKYPRLSLFVIAGIDVNARHEQAVDLADNSLGPLHCWVFRVMHAISSRFPIDVSCHPPRIDDRKIVSLRHSADGLADSGLDRSSEAGRVRRQYPDNLFEVASGLNNVAGEFFEYLLLFGKCCHAAFLEGIEMIRAELNDNNVGSVLAKKPFDLRSLNRLRFDTVVKIFKDARGRGCFAITTGREVSRF